ncbi:amino acid adenylation domain-containing protein [Nonomuraea sp. MCN248]|uniref:Amino acid adenylation domain-containing protein n=1 Tax=Nonomuraea corallina TaxID=2989783 RepID=A0ABT4SB95_9ACTN|nr:non-ribosomal peptide synthetase [Nonomuraea corallina]MDA0634427.1 amino acid adenylation domain-containing protein [Nonomuraea corallina]
MTAPGFPLTPAQERLWFLHEAGASGYQVRDGHRLRGPLDPGRLAAALNRLAARHEALRTRLADGGDGRPVQIVDDEARVDLEVAEVSGEAEARAVCDAFVARPFDLGRAPLLRALLVRLAPDDHVLVLCLHHAVCDGRSLQILFAELYATLAGTDGPEAPAVPFSAYVAKLGQAGPQRAGASRDYWRSRLAGAPSLLGLPTDRPRPAAPSGRGARHRWTLSPQLRDALLERARDTRTTVFSMVLAALGATLGRYADQRDVVVGSPMDGRAGREFGQTVGMFANTVALRLDLGGDPTMADLLRRCRRTVAEAIMHGTTPFDEVVELAGGRRDLSHNPLFQVMLVMDHLESPRRTAGDLLIEQWDLAAPEARFDLTLFVTVGDEVELYLDYATDLFDAETAAALAGHLTVAIEAVAGDPGLPVSGVPFDDGTTRTRGSDVPHEGTGGAAPPAASGTWESVADQVVRRARQSPDRPAVVTEGECLPYGDLVSRARELAARLEPFTRDARPVVGVALPAGPDGIAAILGVLLAGAAYLPLDPAHPPARIAGLLRRAGAVAVVARPGEPAGLDGFDGARLAVPGPAAPPGRGVAAPRPGDPAYVIFTSGSTGTPKGVTVSHGAVAEFSRSFVDVHGFGPRHRVLMLPPLTFDASVGDLFPVLTSGGALIIHPEPARLDGAELVRFCAEHGVTAVDAPVALWRRWVADLAATGVPEHWPVEIMMVGGEEVPVEDARAWQRVTRGRCALFNHYGPTEATVCATVHRVDGTDDLGDLGRVPIGTPLPHVRARVLDRSGHAVPAGGVGELHLGGAGLADGYAGEPALTAAAFVPDPDGPPGARLYRTGDLARVRPGGSVEFLGRRDRQVKIRGHRIEPAEVEHAVRAHPAVTDCAVVVSGDHLVAYAATDLTPAALRAFLRERLPGYLVPSAFVPVAAIPRTAHGKVDQAALPPLPGPEGESPATATEAALAAVWRRVIGVPDVRRSDNFFEVGGHSLLAGRVVAEIRRELGADVPLRAILETADLAELAAAVDHGGAEPEHLDLASLAVLPSDLTVRPRPARPARRTRAILLTGATGFLGAHLVGELLARTDAEIICLVRASGERQAEERVLGNLRAYGLDAPPGRVRGLPGDLTAARFGLDRERFAELAGAVDVICHNGGQVNFYESLHRMLPVNVGGTVEALRAAGLGGARLHFVSTLGVFLGSAHRGRVVTETTAPDDPAGLETGYDQSKWVADRLTRLARDEGMAVVVHRPARVSGHSETGAGNPDDYFARLLATCVRLNMVPDLPLEEDLAPVDHVAAGIAHLIADPDTAGDFHYFNGATISYREIAEALGADLVPWDTWRAHAAGLGADNPMAPFASVLDVPAPQPRRPVFDCGRTERALARAGLVCPPADGALIRRYAGRLAEVVHA